MLLNVRGYGLTDKIVDGTETTVNNYEGSSWAINVILDGNKINLFKGVQSNVNGSITRADAMLMVFNALKADANRYYTDALADEFAIAQNSDGTNATDAYGRAGYAWAVDGENVSDVYATSADYTYNATSATTVGAIIAAYNKANNKEYDATSETAVAAGSVVEFTVTKSAMSVLTTYGYELLEVSKVNTKALTEGDHKGAYTVTFTDTSTTTTDVLGVSVAKGDMIIVPNAGADETGRVYADATATSAVTTKITGYNAAGYVVINGAKVYADGNYSTAITDAEASTDVIKADNYTQGYDFYLSPIGTLLGAVENSGITAEKYTTEYAYVLDSQAKGANDGTDDLFGEVTAATAAAAVVKVLTPAGEIKTLTLAIEQDSTSGNYNYVGTDAINFFTGNADSMTVETKTVESNTQVGKVLSYYTRTDGTIVALALDTPVSVTTTKGGSTVSVSSSDKTATSSTVVNVVTIADDGAIPTTGTKDPAKAAAKYTASTIVGYKNLVATTYANAFVVYAKDSTEYISTIYAFGAAAPEVEVPVAQMAYVKAIGDESASGTAVTFVIEGKEVTYYAASILIGDASGKIAKGEFGLVTLKSDGVTVSKFDETTTPAVDDEKVTYLDTNYVQTETTGVTEYTSTVNVYDVTGADEAVELAVGVKVTIFQDSTTTVIFITEDVSAE
jgi:hypothetical protein